MAKKPSNPRSADAADQGLGNRIRIRRNQLGLSQTDLAAKLGVSFQQVQKYEKGVNRVGAARLNQIAEIFDVPVAFFFNGARYTNTDPVDEIEGLLNDRSTLRMLRAFAGIKDEAVRRSFVTLIEKFTGEHINPKGE